MNPIDTIQVEQVLIPNLERNDRRQAHEEVSLSGSTAGSTGGSPAGSRD